MRKKKIIKIITSIKFEFNWKIFLPWCEYIVSKKDLDIIQNTHTYKKGKIKTV
jgi:hypothetical protein